MTTRARVLVVGREGQVASALAEALPRAGIATSTIARPQIDLMRPDSAAAAIRTHAPTLVINAAAYTAVDKAEDEPELARTMNAVAPGVMAAAAADVGAAFVHLSTDYVFDGTKQSPYVESDLPHPLGVYGATKLEGEQAVVAANNRAVVIRTAWVCSPTGNNFLKTMLRLAAERPALRVVADQWGSPTFAADIAAALARICERLHAQPPPAAEHFGVFHLTNEGITTWHGFASAIMAASARRGGAAVPVEPITTAEYPTRAVRPAYGKLSTEKLARVYGIHLPHWETSLERTIDALPTMPVPPGR